MNLVGPILWCVFLWVIVIAVFGHKQIGAWIIKRREVLQAELAGGRRARCEYGYLPNQPHLCGLPGVHKGAAAIGTVWSDGPCGQCDKGRPRWINAKEIARFEQDIRDGWRKPDGSICDLDLYQAAFARSTTPAIVATERAEAGKQ